MENVVSEIEVVDEGEVGRSAIERMCVGPPQATGPQTVKAPAWKIIGNAPSVLLITHQVSSFSPVFRRRGALSPRVRPLDFFSRRCSRDCKWWMRVPVRYVFVYVRKVLRECDVPHTVDDMRNHIFLRGEPGGGDTRVST